jgi:predicted O-linked N-acetylglucosamine transferase (SPINDLY family)
MLEQSEYDQIECYLSLRDYNNLITLLEQYIEVKPETITYYWYLGLAYLLQENLEIAQEIWLSLLLNGNLEVVDPRTQELILFLEAQVESNLALQKLGNAKIVYEAITIIDPNYEDIELLNRLVEALSLFASTLSFDQEYQSAVEVYQVALAIDPENAISNHGLALTYYYLKDYDNAKKIIKQAIQLDQEKAEHNHVLGMTLEKQAEYDQAISAYNQAIEKDYKFLSSYYCLVDLYVQQQLKPEIIITSKIVANFFKNSILMKKLGDAYQSLGDLSYANLYWGYSAYYSNDENSLPTALKYFEQYYQLHVYKVSINFNFYAVMANCYAMCDYTDSAIVLLEQAAQLFPLRKLEVKRLNQCLLPIIYKTTEEINYYRQRFSYLLNELISATSAITVEEKTDIINMIGSKTNFYLSYQNKNDLTIQKKWGDYVHLIMEKAFPQFCQPIRLNYCGGSRRIRVGLASHRLNGLGRLYLGWVKYLDRSKFEVFIYNFINSDDEVLSKFKIDFKSYSDQFKSINFTGNSDKIANTIINDQLDILIFPDFGIDSPLNMLAYLRFAPIQCTTWGHPITSGSPTIDYFLSSNLMEPINGDEHYLEQLIRLPNLGFSLPPVTLPLLDKNREYFQLDDNKIVYLCCQSLFKYLPQHDYIFAKIASYSPSFQFVFVAPINGEIINERFKSRLEKAFRQFDLDYREYCVFLPRLTNTDFIKFNQVADIFLDCLSWSGGLTSHQAIACSLPIVTCPGEFMRARHSYGILRMLGVMETIANNETEYIDIAVKLGLDSEWRADIRNKITANKNRIFDDRECIIGLETFFEQAIQNHS